jgi:predicted outer membrane repeat protein
MRGKANNIKWLLWVLFLMAPCATTRAGIIYVDADAAGAGDGSSWANAFNYLQDALITASAGDEIRIAEGIYRPNQGLIPLPGRVPRTPDKFGRSATFRLKAEVIIKGGFAGFGASDPNQRDPEIYRTILSGDLDENDIDVNEPRDLANEPTRAENSHNVLTIFEDDSNIILDGLIVTSATKGGLANISGNPSISNCVFMNNSNDDDGGAIVSIDGSTFLTNCKFVSNFAAEHGGAIYSDYGNDVFIECSFVENSALDGTGIVNIEGNLELESCTFSHNSTYSSSSTNEEGGGAVFIVSKKVVVKNCLFNENVARYGGAMVGIADALILERCVFTGNSAEYGGAIFDLLGGTITNSIFAANRGDKGGAVFGRCIGPALINCTLSGNSAQNGNAIGWFPCYENPSFTMNIRNCILRNGGDEIGKWEDELPDISIVYSDIQGGWPGEGNIDIDPQFTDFENGDFHLKSQAGRWDPNNQSWIVDDVTSPCIDTGDPSSPVAFEQFPNGGIINMGAYGGTAEASKSPSGIHAKYGGGSGTAEDPYLIYTAEQMNTIGAEPNDWGKHFKLMADIDLKNFGVSSFNLIGSDSQPFFGVFSGNGHSISNLTYAVTGSEVLTDDSIIANFGLFRTINDPNAMIRDLRLVNPDIGPASTCAKRVWHVGALAGSLGSGTVSNCRVEGGQVQGESRTGGLTGLNRGTISDCYTTCRVQQAEQRSLTEANESLDRCEFFGGLIGVNFGEIFNCHAVGEISGERKIGGLVGEDYGIISNSWSDSDVSGDLDIGGLVGKNRYTSVLSDCYATGYVSGTKSIGGLIGYCTGSIIDCHATGSISADQWGGGLAGLNEGTITSCYSIASVSVDSDTAGGLVGLNGGAILTSLARGIVTGEQSIGGLVGENRKWYQVVAGIPIEYDGVVLDSYAEGNVHGKNGVGGLVGTNTGTILKCYSIGEVTGERNFGGLVGINGEIQVMGSFWDTETSGLDASSGGTGKTTTEMQIPSTFLEAGWNLVDETTDGTEYVWRILEGQDYPRLWWEFVEEGE